MLIKLFALFFFASIFFLISIFNPDKIGIAKSKKKKIIGVLFVF